MDISQSKPAKPEIIAEKLILENFNNLKLRAAKENFEKKYIENLLHEHHWHKAKVASILGVNRRTLFRKIKTYRI